MLIKLNRKVNSIYSTAENGIQSEVFRVTQKDIRNNVNVEPYIVNTNRIADISRYHFSPRDEYWKEGAKTVLRIGRITVYVIECVEEIATLSNTKTIRSALT